jgi:hypothetical protein
MTTNALVANLSNNDVLLGRGTGANEHEGNKRFRGMASHCLLKSMNNPSSIQISKLEVARQLVAMVHYKKGKFVRKLTRDESKAVTRVVRGSPNNKKCWIGYHAKDLYVVVPEDVAVEKAKQSFRHQLGLLMKKGDVPFGSASCKSPLISKVGDTTDFKYSERGVEQEDSRPSKEIEQPLFFLSNEEQESKAQETISSFKSPPRRPAYEKSDTKRYDRFAAAVRKAKDIESRTFRIGQYLLDDPFRPLHRREPLAANRGGTLGVNDPLLRSIRRMSPPTLFKINTAEELPKGLIFVDPRRRMTPPSSATLGPVASGPAAYQSSWLRHTLEREALSIQAALLRDEMHRLLSVPQRERDQEKLNRQEQQKHYATPLRVPLDPDPSVAAVLSQWKRSLD